MQNVKQNLLPLITWASFIALAFSTMTEVPSYNRSEPGLFGAGKAMRETPHHLLNSHGCR